jgi:catechol 2,3-dioxygenase-like lactoylglutathione lyase family enzyme
MSQQIAHIALVVDDYDDAIQFYTQKLNFDLLEDIPLSQAVGGDLPGERKRWVLVAPKGSGGCSLLLAKAANEEQKSRVGNQTGGRVFLFLKTDDFWKDYNRMLSEKINFIRPPKEEVYGTVAVFEDLYGNLWDLIQFSDPKK